MATGSPGSWRSATGRRCAGFLRLAPQRGWGTREGWTHFDGDMASKQGKFPALAGGDVRFGGVHDLAVGADDDSDRLFARLALVQRRRFATW